MALNIAFEQLERESVTGVVKTIHWRANKTTNGVSAERYGSVNLPPKDPEDPEFVAFENVTPAIVETWLAGQEDLVTLENAIDAEITAKSNPVIATGFPSGW